MTPTSTPTSTPTPTPELENPRALFAQLTGSQEEPEGDEDGRGTAMVGISGDFSRLCYLLLVYDLENVTMAHIHRGAPGVNGPVEVPLEAPSPDGMSAGCVDIDADLGAEIAESPWEFYVNVHTEEFPDGAIRGQLTHKRYNQWRCPPWHHGCWESYQDEYRESAERDSWQRGPWQRGSWQQDSWQRDNGQRGAWREGRQENHGRA